MSSLAFDKQGKPFSFLRRTKKLLVRLFRNPSARGTCSQVLTADGQPLYVDPETDYVEFRKAVGHVPGLYRLDQCDENGAELDEAPAAYVAIDMARNASASVAEGGGASEVNPLVIIEHLVAIQADAMKTMAAQQAAIMAAQAEIMRAPYRPAPAAPAPSPVPRNAQPDDDHGAHEHDEALPVVVESPWAAVIEKALPMFQAIGGFVMVVLQQKFLPGTAIAMPNMPGMAMPGVATASAAPAAPVAHIPVNVGAAPFHGGSAPPHVATVASSMASTGAIAASAFADETTAVTVGAAGSDDAARSSAALATAVPVDGSASSLVATPGAPSQPQAAPMPLPQQFAHLLAIRARLQPDESAVAEAVIAHMAPERRAQWIAALSAMSLDEATASIRTTIAQLRMAKS